MSQGGGGSSKPKGVGHEEIVTLARRPPRHSSLFWYLFDQHDELIEAKKQSGLGIPWESMLPRFAALNLTLWKGKAITLRGAEQTFLRVQKKKARLAALEAQAGAEHEARREADPRRNMPSRFTGSFPAPLADRQPPLATTSSTAKPPAMNSVPRGLKAGVPAAVGEPTEATRIGWTSPAAMTLTPSDRPMPGGPVPIGGWEERLSWEDLTIIFENEPFDLRLLLDPESQRDAARPWRLGDVSPEGEVRSFQGYLIDRFKSWRKDRRGYSANQIDRTWRKYLGKP